MSVRSSILFCTSCPLHEQVYSPVPYSGPAPNPFIVIGEAPGVEEDKYMQPFIGKSGRLLRQALDLAYGEKGFSDALSYMNVVCCYPSGTPTQEHIRACNHNLQIQLEILAPRFGLVLGGTALNALYPAVTRPMGVKDFRGTWVALRGSWGPLNQSTLNGASCLFMVTWHPSAILRSGGLGSTRGQEWLGDLAKYVEACNKFTVRDHPVSLPQP